MKGFTTKKEFRRSGTPVLTAEITLPVFESSRPPSRFYKSLSRELMRSCSRHLIPRCQELSILAAATGKDFSPGTFTVDFDAFEGRGDIVSITLKFTYACCGQRAYTEEFETWRAGEMIGIADLFPQPNSRRAFSMALERENLRLAKCALPYLAPKELRRREHLALKGRFRADRTGLIIPGEPELLLAWENIS